MFEVFVISWTCFAAIVASLPFYWVWKSVDRYFWRSILVAVFVAAISKWCLNHIQFHSTKTVNGEVIWNIDSKWCFGVSWSLALGSLVFTIFMRLKSLIAWPKGGGSRQP